MSWQAYVDDSLIGSGFMHSAAIVSLTDGSYWAYGGTYIPQPEEVTKILKSVQDPSLVQTSGVTVAGVKFFGLQSGTDSGSKFIFFKKGSAGGCVYTSTQAAIIAVYGDPSAASALQSDLEHSDAAPTAAAVNPADCNATVKRVAEYLISLGY